MSGNGIPDEILLVPIPDEIAPANYDPLLDSVVEGDRKASKAITARLSELSPALKEFLSQLKVLLKDAPEVLGDFGLEEVEVSAGVTINGKFVLFGIGAEGGMDGGLKFLFKRTSHSK